MANHKGSEGTVKIGTNTVAEITGFEISESAEVMEDTELGDAAKTFQAGNTSWTGSVDCWWDETDTNGQMAMTVGSSATYALYPEGATSADTYYVGVGIITNVTRQNRINSIVSAAYSIQGSGALTKTTV